MACHHSLATISGYVVRRTFPGRSRPHVDVVQIDGANNYWRAVELSRDERIEGQYAVIDTLYACGCRSR